MRRADPSRRLLRALERAGDAAGLSIAWELVAARPWVSALFVGARHRLRGTAAASAALDAFLGVLPEANLALPGGHVADLTVNAEVDGGNALIDLTVLVIEDC